MIHHLLDAMAARLRSDFAGIIAPTRIVVGAEPARDINLFCGGSTGGGENSRKELAGRLCVSSDIVHEVHLVVHGNVPATTEQWMVLALAMIATERDSLLATCNQSPPHQAGDVSAVCLLEQLDFCDVTRADGHLEARLTVTGQLVFERAVTATGAIDTITLDTTVANA